ncbi:hypothetical protein DW195_07825 [Collinsella sp. AM17-1]|nr:hypothetical protein DW195_07825 [Collinsella sp. AM17-1]
MFTSRLGILECLISISRHILGLRIINGLLRDVGAMESNRLRAGCFVLLRHKRVVLFLIVHDAL